MTDTKWSEWIEWNATDDSVCPLEYGVFSEVQLLSGCRISNHKCPEEWDWNDTGGLSTICAYRYELTEDPDARMDNIARNGNDGEHYPPAEQSMPADLEDLARTVLEWNESLDRVCKHTIGVEWFSSEHYPGRHGYTEDELLQARRDLGLVTTEGEDEAFDAIGKRSVFDEIVEGFDALGKGNVKSFRVQDKQSRYQDTTGEDWIDEAARTFTAEEFRGAMRFTIGKYNRRMGKKDDLIKEIEKMRDYCQRWIDVEKGR